MNAAMTHYESVDVGAKKMKNLTPRDVTAALLVEYMIMTADKSVFCQDVVKALRAISIQKHGGSLISLDLVELWCELFNLFRAYEDDEFAIATFGSMYGTRVDTETTKFDPNFHISGKEAFSGVDDLPFTKLFKMWNFVMSELFYRFFYTYDFRCVDTERAYYTVLGDATKRKRTGAKFCEFLLAYRPLYAQICMLSPEKREIYTIFTDAAAHAKSLREQKQCKLAEKRKELRHGGAPAKKVVESHVERLARLDRVLKKMDIVMGRIPNLEAQIVGAEVFSTPPPPKSVWKLPVAAPTPAPAPATPVESVAAAAVKDDDGFTTVKVRKSKQQEKKPQPKHQGSRSQRMANLA
jgi:hypothetical protein